MVSVFICEDDKKQRNMMEDVISKYLLMKEWDMKLVLSTANPQDVLDYLSANPNTLGVYFLDVDLNHKLNGIALASEIRKLHDVEGKIIFVTSHAEHAHLTFAYMVEALSYIVKGLTDVVPKIKECLDIASKHLLSNNNVAIKKYQVKVGEKIKMLPFEEIMFLAASEKPHTIVLHLNDGQLTFRGSLSEELGKSDDFFRCHRSYVVNINNIKSIDKKMSLLEMKNGEKILISRRKRDELERILNSDESAKKHAKKLQFNLS